MKVQSYVGPGMTRNWKLFKMSGTGLMGGFRPVEDRASKHKSTGISYHGISHEKEFCRKARVWLIPG